MTDLSQLTDAFGTLTTAIATASAAVETRIAALEAAASPYPPNTTLSYVATPSVPLPGYLVPIIDPTFGTKITRISNVAGQAPKYSKDQCWNADESLLLLGRVWPGILLHGQTYAEVDGPNVGTGTPGFHHPSEPHWHPTNPRVLYGVSGNKMTWVDPLVDQTFNTLHTFTGYTNVSHSAQGNYSNDGRYAALTGVWTVNGTSSILVYDIVADSVVATKTGFTTPPHALTMSQSGDYVIVGWSGDGPGAQQGTWLYSRSLGTPIRQLFASTAHADSGYDSAGNEVWVGGKGSVSASTQTLYMQRLSAVVDTPILPNLSALFWNHLSCRNTLRPGWAYLSNYDTITPAGKPGNDQLIAVKLDGSMTVEVFGHAHHGSNPTYVLATPNRTGTRVLFGSEWGAADVFAYIAEAAG